MRDALVSRLFYLGVRLYRATLRLRVVGLEHRAAAEARGRPVLHAIWHQRLLLGVLAFPRSGTVTMASRSRDGELIARFLTLWGFVAVRGSSSRGGGLAYREMVEVLRGTARWAALTPDGPRGPARVVKPGVARLADEVGAAILPAGSSATRVRFLGSWDRFLLPLPFSKAVVVFGPALLRVPGEADDAFIGRLAGAIDAATDEADRLCGILHAPRER